MAGVGGGLPPMGLMGNAPQAPPVTMHAWVQNIVDGANAAIALLSPH